MKKFVLSIIIAAGGLLTQTAHAQVGVNVGVRIGPLVINLHKPIAPAVVYDDFYYLPEVDAYYSVPEHCYYYNDGYNWVNAPYLPGRYRNYDWRNVRRYEVRTQRPYANHEYYRNKFGGSRNSWDNRGGKWGNDQYANRMPDRRDDRGNNRPFAGSPYDSNNAGGRGGYNQPNRGGWNGGDRNNDNRGDRNDDNRGNDNRGGRNGGDRNNEIRGNDSRGGWNGGDRNQGGNNAGQNQNGGRDGNNNSQPGRNNGQGGFGQPSNNNGGQNQGGGRGNGQPANQGGDRDGNRGGSGNSNGGVPSRQHFAGNLINDNSRLQRGGN